MEVFHGVATTYLANYMAWHVFYQQAQSIQLGRCEQQGCWV